jgi:hypothetical protein
LNHLCYSLGSPFGTDEQFSKPSLKYKFCKKQQAVPICSQKPCRDSLSTDLQHNNPVPDQPQNHSPEESSVNLTRLCNNMKEKALPDFG